MKEIYIIRHAKSSWDNIEVSDFDRPLNERGKKDAPQMAQRFKIYCKSTPIVITSTAVRALETAKCFAFELGIDESQMIKMDTLYHASDSKLLETIKEQQEDVQSIAIFSHNPGITLFGFQVDDAINDVATCGILCITSKSNKWIEVDFTNMVLQKYLYPKEEK